MRSPSFWRLWGWPLAIALLTATGLVSALVSDAAGDWWSWFALGAPVLVMAWFGSRRPSAPALNTNNISKQSS